MYAIPDERMGEEVAATVYTSADAALDHQTLNAFLAERLAKFKIPRYLNFTHESLPRIASGKIFKRQLREDALRKLEAL